MGCSLSANKVMKLIHVHTGPGAYPASCPVGTGSSLSGGNEVWT
jgi:hypothetical protein